MSSSNWEQRVKSAKWYGGDETFFRYTFDNFQKLPGTERGLAAILKLQMAQVPGLILAGPVGGGKTHLMKAMWNHLLDQKLLLQEKGETASWTFFWISMSGYLDQLREKNFKIKERAKEATMLFIDDLGAAPDKEWAVDQIFQLIDYRYERKLQTFITTNKGLDELSASLSERVTSRIFGMTVQVVMSGKDFRKETESKNNMGKLFSIKPSDERK